MNRIDEIFLEIGLLQVDEGGIAVACFGLQVEIKHFVVGVEDLAHIPDHTFVDHGLARTKTVCDIQRAFGKTDRLGAQACTVMVIQHQCGRAFETQIKCQSKTDRAATDNHNRMAEGGIILRCDLGIGVKLEGSFIACCDHCACLPVGI